MNPFPCQSKNDYSSKMTRNWYHVEALESIHSVNQRKEKLKIPIQKANHFARVANIIIIKQLLFYCSE